MKKYFVVIGLIILLLAAVVSRNFWSPGVKSYWSNHRPSLRLGKQEIVKESNSNLDSLMDSFTFAGRTYHLYRIEKIADGWSAYYTSNLDIDPYEADNSIAVNFYISTDSSNTANAKNLAAAIADIYKQNGAVLFQPFSNQDMYLISMYSIYPENRSGAVFLTKVIQDDIRAYSVMYVQKIQGLTKSKIEQTAKQWLTDNIGAYGKELDNIKPSDLWFKK